MDNIFPDLIGVVACGGNSSRMGSDKSFLNYQGKPQRYFLYELLKTLCNDVFISCNKIQADKIEKGFNYIVDNEKYENNGPISGLLTTHLSFPNNSILYVGCDYPFLNSESIQELTSGRNNKSNVICFRNTENQIIEPLIAIYENSCFNSLLKYFDENNFSLRRFIESVNSNCLIPTSSTIIKSVDTLEEFYSVRESIQNNILKLNF